jgi:hypothetical protein
MRFKAIGGQHLWQWSDPMATNSVPMRELQKKGHKLRP